MSSFYRDFIIVTLLGIAGPFSISHFYLHDQVPLSYWISMAVISIVTVLIHKLLVSANDKRPQLFVAYFMGTLTGKIFLSGIILIAVAFVDKPNLTYTALGYFAMYILLMAIELRHLLPLVRNSRH
jgi:hypothetical protein